MLVNQKEQSAIKHVEFVSYTGKYPNLCDGTLTLKIDGKFVRFGYDKDTKYPRFWSSGGECRQQIYTGEWKIDMDDIPKEFHKYAAEIDRVFNENVEHGCCGGCR